VLLEGFVEAGWTPPDAVADNGNFHAKKEEAE